MPPIRRDQFLRSLDGGADGHVGVAARKGEEGICGNDLKGDGCMRRAKGGKHWGERLDQRVRRGHPDHARRARILPGEPAFEFIQGRDNVAGRGDRRFASRRRRDRLPRLIPQHHKAAIQHRFRARRLQPLPKREEPVRLRLHPLFRRVLRQQSPQLAEFLYTLSLPDGQRVMAHVPSHHDHQVGEWIGIRAEVDHVVTFPAEVPAAG